MFNHLKVPDQWRNYWTKYPNGYTILESLMDWIAQVDSMVDNINTWNDYLNNFKEHFEFELSLEVIKTLEEWHESGFLDDVINAAIGSQVEDLTNIVDSIYVNVKTFGAKGDGVSDDTLFIQEALDTLKNVLIPPGVYMINATRLIITNPGDDTVGGLFPHSNQKITFANGAILKVIPSSAEWYSIFALHNVENVIIENAHLIGDRLTHLGSTGEWGYGISIMSSKRINLTNCKADDFWGDGFFIGCTNHMSATTKSKDVTMLNCYASNNRRQGLSVTGVDGLLVDGGEFNKTNGTEPSAGIDFEPNNIATINTNCKVKNVVCRDNDLFAIMATENQDITIENCYFTGNKRATIYAAGGSDIKINRCYLEDEHPLYFQFNRERYKFITFKECKIELSQTSTLVSATGAEFPYKGYIDFINNDITYKKLIGESILLKANVDPLYISKFIRNRVIIPPGFDTTNFVSGNILIYSNSYISVSENEFINHGSKALELFSWSSDAIYGRPNSYKGGVSDQQGKANGDFNQVLIGVGNIAPGAIVEYILPFPLSSAKIGDRVYITPLFASDLIFSGYVVKDGELVLKIYNAGAEPFFLENYINLNVERGLYIGV